MTFVYAVSLFFQLSLTCCFYSFSFSDIFLFFVASQRAFALSVFSAPSSGCVTVQLQLALEAATD